MLQWSDIRNLSKDSELFLKTEAVQNGRTYWFWYFLSEALDGAKAKADHQAIITATMNKYFDKNAQAPTVNDPRLLVMKRDSASRPLIETVAAGDLRRDLTQFLIIGFKCVGPEPGEITTLKQAYGTYRTKVRDNSKQKETHFDKGYLKTIDKKSPLIVWRTAQVPLNDIKKDVEIRAKVDIKEKATQRNITADFNPFSDDQVKSYYWFRKKSSDNDCQALASVGNTDQWKAVAAFPLLNSYSRKYQVKATCTRGTESKVFDFWAADVSMVLFLLHGTVLDTNEMQQHYGKLGFPEYGIKGIDQAQVYGAIHFTRVHHGPGQTDDSTGFTVFYKDHWVQYDSWTKADHIFTDYETVYNRVKENFDKALVEVKAGKTLKWAMDGFVEGAEAACTIETPTETPPRKIYKVASYVKA
jgi:hypothetical protein